MKKILVPVMAAIALFTSCKKDSDSASATVITKADFANNYKVNGSTYTLFNVNLTASPVSVPASGENQIWDFSTATEASSYVNGGTNFIIPPANSAFSTATFAINNNTYFSVGSGVNSNSVPKVDYYELNDNGFYYPGYATTAAATATAASLGATFNFPAQSIVYSQKYPIVVFPAKYNDSVIFSNSARVINYTVTAASFGLNNAPGQTRDTTNSVLKVFATGTVKLKTLGTVKVIVVREKYSIKTNYYLNGAAAPATLLTQLGVTNGAVVTGYEYSYFAPSLGRVATIDVNSSNIVILATFRKG